MKSRSPVIMINPVTTHDDILKMEASLPAETIPTHTHTPYIEI